MSERSTKKIGVSIFPPTTGFSPWSNGAHQNCFFLAMCLRAAGYDVAMINGGDGDSPLPNSLPQELRTMPFVRISDEVCDGLDLLIQAGAQISAAHIERVHAHGGKAVSFKFGSDFPIDAERAVHNLPSGAIFNGSKFDEIWTTTQHTEVCGDYWRVCYRAPVRVLPHIWHPAFCDQMTNMFPSSFEIGYKPGRAKKRIAILEPNINLVKTCHIPMLIAEDAFRRDPSRIEVVLVSNAERLKGFQAFATFIANLNLFHAKADDGLSMISFEPRFNTPWFLSKHADIVISHQWIAVANYSHYDALHLGYPIVHNVPEMADAGVGYYYPKFEAVAGATQLLECIATYDDERDMHRAAGRAFLNTRIATSRANIAAHRAAVEEVLA